MHVRAHLIGRVRVQHEPLNPHTAQAVHQITIREVHEHTLRADQLQAQGQLTEVVLRATLQIDHQAREAQADRLTQVVRVVRQAAQADRHTPVVQADQVLLAALEVLAHHRLQEEEDKQTSRTQTQFYTKGQSP